MFSFLYLVQYYTDGFTVCDVKKQWYNIEREVIPASVLWILPKASAQSLII